MGKDKVTVCVCASRSFMDKNKLAEIAAILQGEGMAVSFAADICRVMMNGGDELEKVAGTVILACYPRAVRSHFDTVGKDSFFALDVRNLTAKEIVEQMGVAYRPDTVPAAAKEAMLEQITAFEPETGWDAWYPVIDKERCVECEKCHDFCLFGVYSVIEGRVRVTHPENCKNNCPACARICPAKAVIFPKYEKSPVNGGLEEEEAAISLDTKVVYADALRTRLQHRRASVSLLKRDNR